MASCHISKYLPLNRKTKMLTWIVSSFFPFLSQIVTIRFQIMELEYHQTCNYDYIRVLEGEELNSTFDLRFCGLILPPPVKLTTPKLIVFSSDQMFQFRGFSAVLEFSPVMDKLHNRERSGEPRITASSQRQLSTAYVETGETGSVPLSETSEASIHLSSTKHLDSLKTLSINMSTISSAESISSVLLQSSMFLYPSSSKEILKTSALSLQYEAKYRSHLSSFEPSPLVSLAPPLSPSTHEALSLASISPSKTSKLQPQLSRSAHPIPVSSLLTLSPSFSSLSVASRFSSSQEESLTQYLSLLSKAASVTHSFTAASTTNQIPVVEESLGLILTPSVVTKSAALSPSAVLLTAKRFVSPSHEDIVSNAKDGLKESNMPSDGFILDTVSLSASTTVDISTTPSSVFSAVRSDGSYFPDGENITGTSEDFDAITPLGSNLYSNSNISIASNVTSVSSNSSVSIGEIIRNSSVNISASYVNDINIYNNSKNENTNNQNRSSVKNDSIDNFVNISSSEESYEVNNTTGISNMTNKNSSIDSLNWKSNYNSNNANSYITSRPIQPTDVQNSSQDYQVINICSRTTVEITSRDLIIESPGFGDGGSYPPSTRCDLLIHAPANKVRWSSYVGVNCYSLGIPLFFLNLLLLRFAFFFFL